MEEKLKALNGQSGDTEVRLFQRCQELQCLLQEKEEVIALLEQQLEEQVNKTNTPYEKLNNGQAEPDPQMAKAKMVVNKNEGTGSRQ